MTKQGTTKTKVDLFFFFFEDIERTRTLYEQSI